MNISKNKLLFEFDSDMIKKIFDVNLNTFYKKIKIASTEYYVNVDDNMIDSFKELLISNLNKKDYFAPIEIQNRDVQNINSGNIVQFNDKKTLSKEEAKKLFY